MAKLVICKCGLHYGKEPERYSLTNSHPRNFCDACGRGVDPSEVECEYVSESVYVNTPKHHFKPNYVDY